MEMPPDASGSRPPASDRPGPMSLEAFETLANQRRATRRFRPIAPDRKVVERLLRIAQWAPSGFNLQPTRFIVVEDRSVRPALRRACMDQRQLEEAPFVVIFAGDRRAYETQFGAILDQERAAGTITESYAAHLRRIVPLMFSQGPAGFGWLWKAVLVPLVRRFRPVPEMIAVHKRFWITKQVMLSAMNFMLAAQAAGLNTSPMEGFDAGRLRKVLRLPRSLEPILVVALGYGEPLAAAKTRLPLEQVTIWR
ncbi:MAG: nitroreductase family protein [Verrucomicrobia bacterium]|nr:nitroreductase family protein [Verrucomicrobiota bacterium]